MAQTYAIAQPAIPTDDRNPKPLALSADYLAFMAREFDADPIAKEMHGDLIADISEVDSKSLNNTVYRDEHTPKPFALSAKYLAFMANEFEADPIAKEIHSGLLTMSATDQPAIPMDDRNPKPLILSTADMKFMAREFEADPIAKEMHGDLVADLSEMDSKSLDSTVYRDGIPPAATDNDHSEWYLAGARQRDRGLSAILGNTETKMSSKASKIRASK